MKRSVLTALAVVAVAACSDDASDPVGTDLAATFVPCVFNAATQLAVGEARTLTGAEASTLCLQAGRGGADYTLVPFLAEPDGEARLRVEALGANLQGPMGPPNPARLPRAATAPTPDRRRHLRLMERMRAGLEPRIRPAAGERRSPIAAPEAPPADLPVVGGTLPVHLPRFYLNEDPCTGGAVRQARVGAVTQRAILVTDPLNPAGGLTDAELRAFGEEFDRQIYGVNTRNFGTPSDLDENGGRVIIVFTREVNLLTPPNNNGYVGGFFWAGDLFPRTDTPRLGACPRSNVGEIFYLLTPDPSGSINGNVRGRDLILTSAAGTIAHEFEHLINASRRIFVNDADDFEEAWLDEALAHSAEELNFYAATGFTPRRNIGLREIAASNEIAVSLERYMVENFARYMTYLEAPDINSVIGPDLLETRGGSWAFLRYAADRYNRGDPPFFFSLVNNRETGIANLSEVIGDDALDWIQDWTLSVYTDDAVPGVDVRFQQPSWDFRSIMPQISLLYGGTDRFPLNVRLLASAEERDFNLRGGGAAYLRFGIGASARVGLRLTSDAGTPPESLRFSLVRTR